MNKNKTILILNRFNNKVIFEFECNSIKECVEEAAKQKVNLGGEKLTKNPIYINAGLEWQIWITDKKIKIGCQIHTTLAWSKFTDEQISKMDRNALEFWKKWKEPILAMAKEHQKIEKE